LLRIENVETWYGAIQALKGISMHVGEGEVVALLGANGAGKTTLIRTITGLLKPARGQVIFQGQSITGLPAEEIAGRRIACVPEGRHIFPGLTVLDNLILGSVSRGRLPKAELEKDLEKIFESFPILRDFKIRLGWQLSGGQQQMLAIGRGLMAKPKMLLLDEPSLGLAPVLVQEVFRVIKKISQSGTTILLVEQNARMALSVADRGYVLSTGNMVLADTTTNLLANTEMQQHYLGGKRKKAHN
jgi:branched-chain amino acid transport system ATP-binding protein